MEKFHLCNPGIKAISIPVVRLSVPRSHSLLLLLCLLTVSQTQGPLWWTSFLCIPWGKPGAAHMCLITAFYLDPSNSNCLMLWNPEARTRWVKLDIYLFIVHIKSQFTANNLRLRHRSLSLTDSLYKKKETRQGWDKIRTHVRRPSFMLNQPADGLIGMLMRLARCLLDQFDLKDTTPASQLRIREWRKSPIPVRRSPVAPDCAASAQFNQRRSRACRKILKEHFCTNAGPSHTIKSTFGPSGFYC